MDVRAGLVGPGGTTARDVREDVPGRASGRSDQLGRRDGVDDAVCACVAQRRAEIGALPAASAAAFWPSSLIT